MKYTSIAAATILALAGTAPVFAAGDKSHGAMEGRTGASASSSMQQGQYDQQTIRQVQQQLSQKGHDVSVDGQLGPQTQQALKKFQKDEGLQASGQLDQQTLTALGIDEAQSGSVGGQGSMGSQSGSSDRSSMSGGANDATGGDSRAGSASGLGGSAGSGGMSGGASSGSSSITGSGSTSR